MTFQSESPLDATDWKILRELQDDARLSYNELGRRVALSAPAAAERVRKLEDRGIITGYAARVDAGKLGLPTTAFIQLHCDPEKCLLKTRRPEDFPEIQEMHVLSGSHCSMIKVVVESTRHLKALTDRLDEHGTYIVHIATSTPLANRPVDWENPGVSVEPRHRGWAEE